MTMPIINKIQGKRLVASTSADVAASVSPKMDLMCQTKNIFVFVSS